MAITADDLRYLRRTLTLAKKALGRTSPNPMVGAVVVNDGRIVGEGFHPRAGEPHAEVFALRAAGAAARGGTLYVSLEPCAHYGKTPPCCLAVGQSGIRRVVFASLDPNPLVAGQGCESLRDQAVEVEHGALTREEQQLNEAWRHWMRARRPFVTLKLAATLDGRIATRTGESQWITGESARRDVHRLRDTQDAILTTSATVMADDPALTARLPGGRDPRRVIVDTRLRTSPAARVYTPAERPPLLATAVADPAQHQPYQDRGVEVIVLPAREGVVDLEALLGALGEREILSLLVEAGHTLAASLLTLRLAQKLRYYLAPRLLGGDALPAVGDLGVLRLADAPALRDVTCKRLGDDFRVEGYPVYAEGRG